MKKPLLPKQLITLLTVAVFAMLATSCLNDTDVALAEQVERIDMIIEGDLEDEIFIQSEQADGSIDLVQYDIRNANRSVDFILSLDAERKLVFNVTDEDNPYGWEIDNNGFSLYAQDDQEDKLQYVTAQIVASGEGQSFTSNSGADFPRGTQINVFRIVDYNPANGTILCRIQDFPMVGSGNTDKTIMINGTFRGSLADLN